MPEADSDVVLTNQDRTFVAAQNVRFLSKQPIVGLKLFEKDVLRKRLQITFENEANFNLFCNQVRVSLGIDVNASPANVFDLTQSTQKLDKFASTLADSQGAFSQPPPVNATGPDLHAANCNSQTAVSQLDVSQGCVSMAPSQNRPSDDIYTQATSRFDISRISSQHTIPAVTPGGTAAKHVSMFRDILSQEPHIQPTNCVLSQYNTNVDPNRQALQGFDYDKLETSFADESTRLWDQTKKTNHNTFKITNETLEPGSPRQLRSKLMDVPVREDWHGTKENLGPRSDQSRMELILKNTLMSIVDAPQPSLYGLDDNQLKLKIARCLKDEEFLNFVTRLEELLNSSN